MHKRLIICKYANNLSFVRTMSQSTDRVKRILKSELIKRGISNADLAKMLCEIGQDETKSSIDSKISRGSFSASFFIDCLSVIGCSKIELETYTNSTTLSIAAEPKGIYQIEKHER